MSNGVTYPRNDLTSKDFFAELVVEYVGIPIAAFLGHQDCRMFLEAIPDYMQDKCIVYSNHMSRDCRGESVTAHKFLQDAKVFIT